MPIIIVTGFLATLKTTISKKLEEDLRILSINKDDVKEILVDSIGYSTREENLELSKATFQLMKYLTKKQLNNHEHLIVEANFKPYELAELKKLSETGFLTIYLYGEPAILYERYVQRQETRHPAHTSTGLMSYEAFIESMKQYAIEYCFGEVISVDTSNYTDQDYEDLLNRIKGYFA